MPNLMKTCFSLHHLRQARNHATTSTSLVHAEVNHFLYKHPLITCHLNRLNIIYTHFNPTNIFHSLSFKLIRHFHRNIILLSSILTTLRWIKIKKALALSGLLIMNKITSIMLLLPQNHLLSCIVVQRIMITTIVRN